MMVNGYDQDHVVQLGLNLDELAGRSFGLFVYRPPGVTGPPSFETVVDAKASALAQIEYLEFFVGGDPEVLLAISSLRQFVESLIRVDCHVLPKRR